MLEKEQGISTIRINSHQLDTKKTNPVFDETIEYRHDTQAYTFKVCISINPDDTFLAEGHAISHHSQECSKCLALFGRSHEVSFSDLYLKHQRESLAFESSFEGNVFVIEDAIIDLSKSFEAALAENKELVTLCKDDCKGLCEQCGTDLNQSVCQCEQEITDPRLEALKNFKF